jgi:hypothetical protein
MKATAGQENNLSPEACGKYDKIDQEAHHYCSSTKHFHTT